MHSRCSGRSQLRVRTAEHIIIHGVTTALVRYVRLLVQLARAPLEDLVEKHLAFCYGYALTSVIVVMHTCSGVLSRVTSPPPSRRTIRALQLLTKRSCLPIAARAAAAWARDSFGSDGMAAACESRTACAAAAKGALARASRTSRHSIPCQKPSACLSRPQLMWCRGNQQAVPCNMI